MLSILFGFLSALSWGASDFAGGLASRRSSSIQVVAIAWLAGALLLPLVALASGEALLSWQDWLWCAAAGSVGVIGILILYQAMADGIMGVAASLSAVMAAALPVMAGMLFEGFPGGITSLGFLLALAAVWLVSGQPAAGERRRINLAQARLPLISGVCFGLYFILIHQGSQQGIFWPMVASRSVAGLMLVYFMAKGKRSWALPRSILLLVVINLVLDIGGTAFYILASQAGRMDVAAVLSSLYPGLTILLAWLLLREKIGLLQWVGIGLALVAIVLFSLG